MRQSGRHPYETRFSDFEKKGKKSSQTMMVHFLLGIVFRLSPFH